ncbi:MAG: hypothetical protein LBG69_05850 [Zoogloeaceae bacterium]|jgi:DNA-binding transcriptional MerR regulator|nr:hypothetical protein [Zoogloeaceae bacterium]
MSSVTLDFFEALQSAGVAPEKARTAAQSLDREFEQRCATQKQEIEQQYAIHAKELATKGDVEKVRADVEKVRAGMAELEARIIKWNLGAIIAASGLALAIGQLLK